MNHRALHPLTLALVLGIMLASGHGGYAADGQIQAPEYWPTCASPQNAAPIRPLAGSTGTQANAIAWNGEEYGMIWPANTSPYTLMFRRMYADGTPAAPAVQIGTRQAQNSPPPVIIWTGSEYGIAWIAGSDSAYWQLYFTRIDRNGASLMSPIKVSFTASPETSNVFYAGLAWSGSGYAASWRDDRNGGANADVFATLLTATGAIAGSGTLHDLGISVDAGNQTEPAIAWSPAGNGFVATWIDYGVSAFGEIRARTLSTTGGIGSVNTVVNGAARYPTEPVLAAAATGFGLIWSDQRDGNLEIYFTRLSSIGAEVGADARLTNSLGISWRPALAWTGAEYAAVWDDNRTGPFEIWLQRVNGDGAATGANVQLSSSGGLGQPGIAFANRGFLVAAQDASATGTFILPIACQLDSSAPTCPGNFQAYNITGTSASVSWSPSSDSETDLAYYQVYRNNVPIAQTSSANYNDSGLSLSGTYNYMIQPVNAAQLQNTACTTSIYVKTNSSLTLTMAKPNTNDAGLNWTDAGFNNYNVFRGTSPQVMSQIGATPDLNTQDPNVLTDTLNYFYSVDNPGP